MLAKMTKELNLKKHGDETNLSLPVNDETYYSLRYSLFAAKNKKTDTTEMAELKISKIYVVYRSCT